MVVLKGTVWVETTTSWGYTATYFKMKSGVEIMTRRHNDALSSFQVTC